MAKWYYNRWTVLLALFVVAGPLGLPLLWKSSRFAQRATGSLTALVLLYTGLLLVSSGLVFQEFLTQMREFSAALR